MRWSQLEQLIERARGAKDAYDATLRIMTKLCMLHFVSRIDASSISGAQESAQGYPERNPEHNCIIF